MIIQIGEWVLRNAFQQAAYWNRDLGKNITFAVNVSAYQLVDQKFRAMISALIAEYNIDPRWIELELTETAVMDDLKTIKDTLFYLSDLNFTIVIDDFGTGYSMLSYLKKLPVHALKIDLEFVRDIQENESSAAIVQAIIGLAKNFDLKVVAEGVETKEQEQFLLNNQCRYAQGYLYSKPLCQKELAMYVDAIGVVE